MILWKYFTQYVNKFGKLSSGHRTGNGHFSFQFQRKGMPKNAQTATQLHSSHMLASSVQFRYSVVSYSLGPHGLQRTRLPCLLPTTGVYSNSSPSNQWCHPAILSSFIPSPPAFNLSQTHGLFQWVSSSYQVAKLLEFQLQHQCF